MHRNSRLLIVICFPFLFGCALSHKPEPNKAPPPPIPSPTKAVGRTVMSADGSVKGEIFGTPAPDSKFSKLQIGMKMSQVGNLIGRPTRTDSRITGKQYQPFYFGGDTLRTENYYKGEGQLTFSNMHPDNEADTLIRIIVDVNASEKH